MPNYPRVTINRKHARVTRLLAHVMQIINPHLKDGSHRDAARELQDLFYAQGVDIITEGMRTEAGLPARDAYGVTLEEIKIIESRLQAASLRPMGFTPELELMVDPQGNPSVFEVKR